MLMIMFDFDAKKPVELAQIGNLYMPGNLNLKISDQHNQCGCNCAVINVNQDIDDSMPFSTEENCLVNIISLEL